MNVVLCSLLACAFTGGLGDLGLGGGPTQPPQAQQPSFQDPFGAPAPSSAGGPPQQAPLPTLVTADKGKGLTLRGQIVRMDGRIGMLLRRAAILVSALSVPLSHPIHQEASVRVHHCRRHLQCEPCLICQCLVNPDIMWHASLTHAEGTCH